MSQSATGFARYPVNHDALAHEVKACSLAAYRAGTASASVTLKFNDAALCNPLCLCTQQEDWILRCNTRQSSTARSVPVLATYRWDHIRKIASSPSAQRPVSRGDTQRFSHCHDLSRSLPRQLQLPRPPRQQPQQTMPAVGKARATG